MSGDADEREMVRRRPTLIGTVAQLITHGMGLRVSCGRCGRREELDLAILDPATRYVGAKFKCSGCGGPGRMTVLANTRPR